MNTKIIVLVILALLAIQDYGRCADDVPELNDEMYIFTKLRIPIHIFRCFRVARWADTFGDELWELAKRMTKSQDIKAVCIYN